MAHLIDKDALVAEIENIRKHYIERDDFDNRWNFALNKILSIIDNLKVKEVDLDFMLHEYWNISPKICVDCLESATMTKDEMINFAKHFFELGLKAQHDNWNVVDTINLPQADRNKIYCIFTKDRYILATVINNPKDEELLQWKCTEFPHHRYDMCEGDKYMVIN